LGDIEIAMKILKEELDENPIDSHYKALMCGLSPLANTNADFKVRQLLLYEQHKKTSS
jgi:hypothetical protein